MPDFEYRAKDGPDKVVRGVLEAASESAAIEKIVGMGLTPVVVTALNGGYTAPSSSRGLMPRASRQERVRWLSRHLSILLKSGIPILKALYLAQEQEKDGAFKAVLKSLSDQIKQGATLSQAMQKFPEMFTPVYRAVVTAGETGGSLQEALERMAEYLKRQKELHARVARALAYPILLLAVGAATVFFLLAFVVPRLTTLFTDIGERLPWPTRVILFAGHIVGPYWWLWLLAAGACAVALPRTVKRLLGRDGIDQIALSLPFLGEVLRKSEIARFARTMEMSLANGVSFLGSLDASIPAVGNGVLREGLVRCRDRVQKGETFGRSLRDEKAFPDFVTQLAAIGEESGRLEETLAQIGEAYEQEVQEKTLFLTTLLEPAMILAVGGVVAFIVVAMLLPIFEIGTGL